MEELILNVYADDGSIDKTYKASTYDLMFGTVMKLMELLKIEELDDQVEMLRTIYGAWNEIQTVLTGVFPQATADDWNHVKVKELLPLIVSIAKYSVKEMFTIPTDSAVQLYANVRRIQIRDSQRNGTVNASGQRVIRRKAGDNWF